MKKSKEDELFAERMQASKLKINGQVILGRANYQLKIEDSIRTLDKDVERLSRLGRTRIDALDDMERRLKRMRHQLKVTSVPTVNDRIAADLYLNNKANVENKFSVCPRCNRKILTNLLQVHDLACARLQAEDTKFLGLRPVPNVGEEVQALIDEHAVFVPQPPRRVRVKQKGTSYIVWEWDKPVYEGGWPVTDYEISYAANIADYNPKTKKYDRYREVCPSLSTSTWCFSEAITHNGYTMVNLRAGTEYTDLMIRCRNKHGWSEWVEMVSPEEDKYDPFAGLSNIKTDRQIVRKRKTPGVVTNPAEPATPPLFFICTLITTSCVHLQWDTPYYDGGLPIVEYAVHYTVMEHVPTATDRDRVEERPNKVKVRIKDKKDQLPGATIKFIIRNLPADTDVVDVVVKAINKSELVGLGAPLSSIFEPKTKEELAAEDMAKGKMKGGDVKMRKNVRVEGRTGNQAVANAADKAVLLEIESGKRGLVVHTKEASRHMQLVEQVRLAELSSDEFIDTDFYTGVTQRLVRKDFILQLKMDIKINPIAPLEEQEQAEWLDIVVAKRKKKADEEAEKRRIQAELDAFERAQDRKYGETDKILFDENDGEERSLEERFIFPFQQRRAHFSRRIAFLEKELKELAEEKSEIDSNRSRLTKYMQDQQIRQIELRMERDRVAAFEGDLVTSSVLHGAMMQYDQMDFLEKVTDFLDETSRNIASSKFSVIKDATRRKEIKNELVATENRLKERQAAFMDFTKLFEKSVKTAELLRRLQGGQGIMNAGGSVFSLDSGDYVGGVGSPSGKTKSSKRPIVTHEEYLALVSWGLDSWMGYIQACRHFHRSLVNLFEGLRQRCLRFAFSKWKTGNFFDNESLGSASDAIRFSKPISVGGVMLKSALEEREDLQTDLRALLVDANVLKQRMHLVNISKESRMQLVKSEEYDNMDEGINLGKMSRRSQEIVNKAYAAMRDAQMKEKGKGRSGGGHKASPLVPTKVTEGVVVHQSDNTLLMRYFYEGDGYVASAKFEAARRAYENQIMLIRANPTLNLKLLSMCHGRLGRLFLAMGKFDRGLVDFSRQLSLAKEIDDEPEVAEANYGIGQGYMMRFDFPTALIYLAVAQTHFTSLHNLPKLCAVMRTMQSCFRRLGRDEMIKQYDERLQQVDGSMARKLEFIHGSFKELHNRLMGNSSGVAPELTVDIERTTLRAIKLKNLIEEKEDEIEECQELLETQLDTVARYEKILRSIDKEMKYAEETDEVQMISYMIMSTPQLADVEEVKTRLVVRKAEEKANLQEALAEERKTLTKIANAKESIKLNQEELDIEEGRLMQRMRNDKPFRCVSFCRFNARGNEVTGTASEGVEWYLASEGSNIHCLDYHSGQLLHVMLGNDKHDITGKITGHSGLVTCLVHDGSLLFSGGTDEWIISWEATTYELLKVFRGHEGSITAIACNDTMLASGAADNTVRLWNKTTSDMIRIVHGHSKSVLTMEIGEEWLCTAGGDEEIRVWTIGAHGKHSIAITCIHRLVGHEVPVTCVRYGELEIMSGDNLGRIFMWWMATGNKPPYIIHKINVHSGPVRCMQFDAVYIVSGGSDGTMCITDIATGEVMQTIRAHVINDDDAAKEEEEDEMEQVGKTKEQTAKEKRRAVKEKAKRMQAGEEEEKEDEEALALAKQAKHEAAAAKEDKRRKRIGQRQQVIAVAFDSNRIISVGTDDTMRYWSWGKKDEVQDKFHVLNKGETLITVSKFHNLPMADLMKWNGITEANQIYIGMRLIVRKANPDEPTKAEMLVNAKEMKKHAGFSNADKKLAEMKMYSLDANSQVFKNRVERNAVNPNKESSGNRMFRKAKKDMELFPDPTDTYVDPRSLSNRIIRNKQPDFVGGAPEVQHDYYITSENLPEWGPVADGLVTAMLGMFLEYESFDVATECKQEYKATYGDRKESLHGRFFHYDKKLKNDKEKIRLEQERVEREEQEKLQAEMREIEAREKAHREAEERIEQASALGRIDEGNEEEPVAAGSGPGTSDGIGIMNNGSGTEIASVAEAAVGQTVVAAPSVTMESSTSELPAIRQGNHNNGR